MIFWSAESLLFIRLCTRKCAFQDELRKIPTPTAVSKKQQYILGLS
jgi:hypothetical protein